MQPSFKDQDTQHPPIHCMGVTRRGNDFWGKVIWCATSRIGLTNDELGQSHVRHLLTFFARDRARAKLCWWVRGDDWQNQNLWSKERQVENINIFSNSISNPPILYTLGDAPQISALPTTSHNNKLMLVLPRFFQGNNKHTAFPLPSPSNDPSHLTASSQASGLCR